MKFKIVSFKVAQALAEAKYPDTWADCEHFYTQDGILKSCDEYIGNSLEDIYFEQSHCIAAPSYIEVWLWLWREKIVELAPEYSSRINDIEETLYFLPLTYHSKQHPTMKYLIHEMYNNQIECSSHGHLHQHADPEEAIIAAIDYIVKNNLIK